MEANKELAELEERIGWLKESIDANDYEGIAEPLAKRFCKIIPKAIVQAKQVGVFETLTEIDKRQSNEDIGEIMTELWQKQK